jgi:hypothetical protein
MIAHGTEISAVLVTKVLRPNNRCAKQPVALIWRASSNRWWPVSASWCVPVAPRTGGSLRMAALVQPPSQSCAYCYAEGVKRSNLGARRLKLCLTPTQRADEHTARPGDLAIAFSKVAKCHVGIPQIFDAALLPNPKEHLRPALSVGCEEIPLRATVLTSC